WPTYCTSLIESSFQVALTPGILAAASRLTLMISAFACGEVISFAQSMPWRLMSDEYLAVPLDFNGPSMRSMRLPINVRLSAVGHFAFAILRRSFLRFRRVSDGQQHASVGAATAQVSTKASPHLLRCGVG